MNYYLDTEFLEGKQDKSFLGIKYGETKPTIDLISIGIVSEDDRKYYAISKDFNIKEAWNRFQPRTGCGDKNNTDPKHYWLRENVLKQIFDHLDVLSNRTHSFCLNDLTYLVNKYGKTNSCIAREIYEFCSYDYHKGNNIEYNERIRYNLYGKFQPKFYAYYADYDWVVFCQLFGTMMQLPKGFPMYCIDLKQELDKFDLKSKAKQLPRQENEHNALADAIWNKRLHEFLNKL